MDMTWKFSDEGGVSEVFAEITEDLETRVRGSLLIPIIDYVKTQRTSDEWEQFLRNAGPDAKKAFLESLIPMSWYPFSLALSAVESIVLIRDEEDILQKVAYHTLDFATNFIFRAIFKIGTPEFFMRRADQVWRRFYNRGHTEVVEIRRSYARVELHDFPEMTVNYNRAVMHSMAAVLVKAGAKNTRIQQTKDIVRGDPHSEYHYSWDI